MRIERANPTVGKGWYVGPWNADLAVSVGYANEGIDERREERKCECRARACGYNRAATL